MTDRIPLTLVNGRIKQYPAGDHMATAAFKVALAALNVLTPAADKLPYYTSGSAAALADFTTVGRAFAGLANPSAIAFPRINADNSVTALSASDARTALGLGTMATQAAADYVTVATAQNITGAKIVESVLTRRALVTGTVGSPSTEAFLGYAFTGFPSGVDVNVHNEYTNNFRAFLSIATTSAANVKATRVVIEDAGVAVTGALSATGTVTLSGDTTIGNGTNNGFLALAGSSSNNFGAVIRFNRGGVVKWQVGNTSGILGGSSDALLIYDQAAGTSIAQFTSATGVTFVRTVSATNSPSNSAITGTVAYTIPYSGTEVLNVWGSFRSSGGTVMGYGVKPSSAAATWLSTSPVGVGRMAYIQDSDGHRFLTSAIQTTAQDATVTMDERLRLTIGGDLIIGGGGTTAPFSSPGARGNIAAIGTASGIVSAGRGGTFCTYLYHDASGAELWNMENTFLRFGNNNGESARFAPATRNFLIGTTTDNGQKLQVNGVILATASAGGVYCGVKNGSGYLVGATINSVAMTGTISSTDYASRLDLNISATAASQYVGLSVDVGMATFNGLAFRGDGNIVMFPISDFSATSAAGGTGIIYIGNRSVAPTSNPSSGGFLYAESGALKWRGSSGTVTTVAAA